MVRYLDIEDYDLKYANTLELLILLVSAKSRLDGSIDFCGSLIYKIQTDSESLENSHSIATILHIIFLVFIQLKVL